MKSIAKKAKRDRDEVEVLQEKIRELKSINRSLHKQLKKINKGYRKIREQEDDESETIILVPDVKICYQCERGVMEKVIIHNRYFRKCTVCDNRTKAKIVNEKT